MSDLTFGGVTIPSQQTLSPAGHADIAFRPACDQTGQRYLESATRTDGTSGPSVAHTLTLPDGQVRDLVIYPLMPLPEAHGLMDLQGYCKEGGVHVPIVYTDQVPQRQVATVTTTPQFGIESPGQTIQTARGQNAELGLLPMIAGGGLLLAVAVAVVWVVRRDRPQPQSPKAKPGQDAASALADIFGGGRDA
ncbi:MAG: hypothetical protein AAFR42_10640 [Cyanobacteria bacterium J06628_6]